jgi:Carboxypeptidase regulatory-like domain
MVSQSVSPDNHATYTLFGTVENSVTSAPIKRALVEIHVGGRRLAFTDSNGQFEFDDLPPADTEVTVRKPGFFSERELNGGPAVPATTKIGPDSQPLNLKLVPQSVITGHIQGVDGEPLEQIPVKALTARIEEGRKRWVPLSASSTDQDGEFRLANLTPGTYYLEIGPSRGVGEFGTKVDAYPARFYPGVAEMSAATPFEIGAGQQVNASLLLRPVPLLKVSGQLTGYGGGGVNIAFVDHLGNNFSFLRLNSATGEFEAEVPAGSYTLKATEWAGDATPRRGEISLNLTSTASGLVIALGTMVPIPIVVRTEDVKHQDVGGGGRAFGSFLNVRLIPLGEQLGISDIWSGFQGAPNPSPVIRDPAAGTYSVEFDANSPWYVQSAQCGATDLLREPLTINPGGQTPPIEVTLRNDGASLTGQVGTGQTRQFATVLLVPDEGSGEQVKTVNTGPDGRFAIGDLPPVGYNVLGVDRAEILEYRNRQVLEPYLSRATHLTLDPNGRQTVHLDLVNVTN